MGPRPLWETADTPGESNVYAHILAWFDIHSTFEIPFPTNPCPLPRLKSACIVQGHLGCKSRAIWVTWFVLWFNARSRRLQKVSSPVPIRAPGKLFSFTLSASLREAWGGDLIPPVAIQERGKLDVLPICPSWGLPYLPVPTPCPSSCANTPIPSASLSSVGDGTGRGRGVSTEGAVEEDSAVHGPGKNLEALSHKRRRLGMNGFLVFL